MNKRWSLLALCVLLAACSVLQPRRVLIAWHALDGVQERAFLDLVDRWNRANPTSAFIVPERHSPDALHRAMLGGPRPALALVEPAQAALYAQRDLLVTLNRFAEDDDPAIGWQADDRADLFPFVFQAGLRPDGRLIGLPFGGDMGLILANRALLGEAQMPQTWEAFDALCDKATDQLLGTFCFGFDLNDGRALEDWLRARGAPIYDPSTRQPILASAGVSAAIAALAKYLDAGQAYRISTAARSQDDFAAGRALFLFANSRDLPTIQGLVSERGSFSLDLGTLPAPADRPAALLSAPLWVIPKGAPQDAREAWLFIRWLLATEQTAEWAMRTNALPARVSALVSTPLDTQQPLDALRVKLISQVVPRAQAPPLLAGWPCVHDELVIAVRQIIELGQPATAVLATAQANAQRSADANCEREGWRHLRERLG
jgi:ABC-type glycerol-3-phosphate transport system substrate-binding protein